MFVLYALIIFLIVYVVRSKTICDKTKVVTSAVVAVITIVSVLSEIL